MKFVFGREYVNVFYEGKQVKFLGELSPPYFYASESSMKWMMPERDKIPTEQEKALWIKVINDYKENAKYEIVFADEQFTLWKEEGKQHRQKILAQKIRLISFNNGEVLLSYYGKVIRGTGKHSIWGVTVDVKTMEWFLTDGTCRVLSIDERNDVIKDVKKFQKEQEKLGIRFCNNNKGKLFMKKSPQNT